MRMPTNVLDSKHSLYQAKRRVLSPNTTSNTFDNLALLFVRLYTTLCNQSGIEESASTQEKHDGLKQMS